MACWTIKVTETVQMKRERAIERLRRELAAGTTTVRISANGAVAFSKPMNMIDDGFADVCAFRKLFAANDPALRMAIMKAEALAGRKVNMMAVASGEHSHDGGSTWSRH